MPTSDTLAAIENHRLALDHYGERLQQHLSWLDTESAKAGRREYLYNVVRDEVLEHGEPTERCQRIFRNLEGNRSWYWEAVREGQNRHRWRKRLAREGTKQGAPKTCDYPVDEVTAAYIRGYAEGMRNE